MEIYNLKKSFFLTKFQINYQNYIHHDDSKIKIFISLYPLIKKFFYTIILRDYEKR